jgi:gluconate 5-dehydrogenase
LGETKKRLARDAGVVRSVIESVPVQSLFDLNGKIALVTGSGQGIGLALARGLAAHGACVVLNGRRERQLTDAAKNLINNGLSVKVAAFDVTDAPAARQGIHEIERSIGAIDILINNAGMQHRTALEDFPEDKWDELLRTNLSSIFHIAPYTATKGAVRNLTRGMCADWARYGLQVNAIAPGYFKTPLNDALVHDPEFSAWLERRTPAGRWGNVEELIGAAVFLASGASSFINGHTLFVDGGITVTV